MRDYSQVVSVAYVDNLGLTQDSGLGIEGLEFVQDTFSLNNSREIGRENRQDRFYRDNFILSKSKAVANEMKQEEPTEDSVSSGDWLKRFYSASLIRP